MSPLLRARQGILAVPLDDFLAPVLDTNKAYVADLESQTPLLSTTAAIVQPSSLLLQSRRRSQRRLPLLRHRPSLLLVLLFHLLVLIIFLDSSLDEFRMELALALADSDELSRTLRHVGLPRRLLDNTAVLVLDGALATVEACLAGLSVKSFETCLRQG